MSEPRTPVTVSCENCFEPIQVGKQARCMRCGVSIDSRTGKAMRVGGTDEFYFKGAKMWPREVSPDETE
jgi:hypothetical protein